ncbi:MAG: GNAT family N-acetyltransferase [Gemmatimonadetes bacterium]|nr:GNAT family N-acetyltransferase [Gemmatimonadota bacterium]
MVRLAMGQRLIEKQIEITIRPLRYSDAAAVQRYASDERVARTITIPQPYPENGGETFVRKGVRAHRNREAFYFAIVADGDMIGVVELGAVDYEKRSARCDYGIASSHWGKGITTRAVALALNYAFCELGMEIVHSACLKRNPASARVLEKNGFQEMDGFIYNSSKFENEPAQRFQLTRQAWVAAQAEESS